MKKITLFLFLILLFVSYSCEKEEFMKFHMMGWVVDDVTKTPLVDVLVEIIVGNNIISTTTDENGGFQLPGQNPGNYQVTFTRPGYLTNIVAFDSYFCVESDNKNSDCNSHIRVNMIPLNTEFALTAYKQFQGGFATSVQNQTYQIAFANGGFINGTTDENGLITEDEMPPASYLFNLSFNFTLDNVRYRQTFSINSSTQTVTILGYLPDGDFGVSSINILNERGLSRLDFPVNNNIEINFTQPVNTTTASVEIIGYAGEVTTTWTNNNMSVILDPSGNLGSATTYALSVDIGNLEGTETFGPTMYIFTTE